MKLHVVHTTMRKQCIYWKRMKKNRNWINRYVFNNIDRAFDLIDLTESLSLPAQNAVYCLRCTFFKHNLYLQWLSPRNNNPYCAISNHRFTFLIVEQELELNSKSGVEKRNRVFFREKKCITTNSTDPQHCCQWHITTGGVMLNAFPDSIFDRPQNGKSEMISKRAVETVDTFRHTQLIRLSNGFLFSWLNPYIIDIIP